MTSHMSPPSHIYIHGPNKRRWEYLERYERQLTASYSSSSAPPVRKKSRTLLQRYLETAPARCVRVVFQSDSEDSDDDDDGDDGDGDDCQVVVEDDHDDDDVVSVAAHTPPKQQQQVVPSVEDEIQITKVVPPSPASVSMVRVKQEEPVVVKPVDATAAVGDADDPICLGDTDDEDESVQHQETVIHEKEDAKIPAAVLSAAPPPAAAATTTATTAAASTPTTPPPTTFLTPKKTTTAAAASSPANRRTVSSESSDESSAMSSTLETPKTHSPNRAARHRGKHGSPKDDDEDDDEASESEESDASRSVDVSDGDSVDSEKEAHDFYYGPLPEDPNSLFSLEDFKHLWRLVEKHLGQRTVDIENGRMIRQANTKMAVGDTRAQCKAQYGRILPNATHKLLTRILHVDKDDIFVDIGHGIGNAVLQAAYTVGCESRGIEVVGDRNFMAGRFQTQLDELRRNRRELFSDRRVDNVGVVELRHGRLELQEYKRFITSPGRRVKAFVNNFDGVFAERSAKLGQKYHLDHFIAGLFAQMDPGSIMVTLHPLTLGHSLDSANDLRRRHGLDQSDLASFFHARTVTLGEAKDVVSWSAGGSNRKPIQVYVYTRIEQPGTNGSAVFLCNNPKCEKAVNNEPQAALGMVDADGEERYVIVGCDCGNSARPLRTRRRVDYHSTAEYVHWPY